MKGFELAFSEALGMYVNRDDITAVMIGNKYTKGVNTRELSIRFGVKKKKSVDIISQDELIPLTIHNIKTDVISINPKLSTYTPNSSVMVGGLSIGPEGGDQSGTLGMVLRDSLTGNLCGITNYHVLADLSQVAMPKVPLDYVIQPGNGDFGSSESVRIGESTRYYIDEDGDAAIFDIYPNGNPFISIANITIRGYKTPVVSDLVSKVGKETGEVKNGVIDAIGYLAVDYSDYGLGSISIYCMAIIPSGSDPLEELSIEGDSGSIVYTSDNYAVGLLFAHSVTTEHFFAYAAFVDALFFDLQVGIIPVVEETSSLSCSCLCASETSRAVPISFSTAGKADYLSCRVFSLTNNETTYATLEEYALAMEYASIEAFLEDYDCNTELEYAQLCGYDTVDGYLDSIKIPGILDNLAAGGITIGSN